MIAWLLHFFNKETFHFKQQNRANYMKFNRAAAYEAYKQECKQQKITPVNNKSIYTQLGRVKKRMYRTRINKLRKVVNPKTKTTTLSRTYDRSQKNAQIKSAIAGSLNDHLIQTAIYQAVALGSGAFSKLDRVRKAATRTPTKNMGRIPIEGQPETKVRRKLHRLATPESPIAGLRTTRTTCLRGLPSFSSNQNDQSIQRLVKQRIQEKCRAKYWDELAEEGIVGISVNGEDGNIIFIFPLLFLIWCSLTCVIIV
jgi:hypothetical protein